MPIIEKSEYKRPTLMFNRHLETIIPGILRKVSNVPYVRERITTRDDDFLDLDWLKNDNERLVIISHGLEGDSNRPYVLGMAKHLSRHGWDILAWNYRGCSGELNRTPLFYHSGATYDLEAVVQHVHQQNRYKEIVLVGYSLGGNMTLKYLGESTTEKPDNIIGAITFSVPLDLSGCSIQINQPYNFLYSRRFLKSLKKKAREKHSAIPGYVDITLLNEINSIYDLDDKFTAPLHGFKSAEDYYTKCSSRSFLAGIKTQTLVVNALNDPFLSASCLDKSLFINLDNVYFETPSHGGHCGFGRYNNDGVFWSEMRALEFIEDKLISKN